MCTPLHVLAQSTRWTRADMIAALEDVGPIQYCMITTIENSALDPYARSSTNDIGPAQFHENGQQHREFLAMGYTDPYSPYQALPAMRIMLLRGEGPAWVSWKTCANKFPEAVP